MAPDPTDGPEEIPDPELVMVHEEPELAGAFLAESMARSASAARAAIEEAVARGDGALFQRLAQPSDMTAGEADTPGAVTAKGLASKVEALLELGRSADCPADSFEADIVKQAAAVLTTMVERLRQRQEITTKPTFSVRGRGRQLGLEARQQARLDYDLKHGVLGYGSSVDPSLLNPRDPGDAPLPTLKGDSTILGLVVQLRQVFRLIRRLEAVPTYALKDIEEAALVDRTVTCVDPEPGETDNSLANVVARTVLLSPVAGTSSTHRLFTLRHELGHVDRTPLGSGGHVVGGLRVTPVVAEEVRAWKNAIRNGHGLVRSETLRRSLATYMMYESKRVRRYLLDTFGAAFSDATTIEVRDGVTPNVDEMRKEAHARGLAIVDDYLMPALRRYARVVRRAALAARRTSDR